MTSHTSLYRSVAFECYSAGSDSILLFVPSQSRTLTISRSMAALLDVCSTARSLNEHKHLARRTLGNYEYSMIDDMFKYLIEHRLLRSLLSIERTSCFASNVRCTLSPINSIIVLTCDNPESLQICLESYALNFVTFERNMCVIVVDDSRKHQNVRMNRYLCSLTQKSFQLEVKYFGPEEKLKLCTQLRAAGVPSKVLSFAFPVQSDYESIGGNRNFASMLTLGQRIVRVDDDTKCVTWMLGDPDSRLAVGNHRDPTEFRFFRTRDEALGNVPTSSLDFIARIECILGRHLGEFCGSMSDRFPDISNACTHLLSDIEEHHKGFMVKIVLPGIAGDSGYFSPRSLFLSRGMARQEMARSEAIYRLALSSRQVNRFVIKPTISHISGCMGMAMGLDNRELLPPFMPHYRNEDGVFSYTLNRCLGSPITAHIPCGVQHIPRDRFSSYRVDHFYYAHHTRVSELLTMLVSSCPNFPKSMAHASRFQFLGNYIKSFSALDHQSFSIEMDRILTRTRSRTLMLIEHEEKYQFDYPEFWKRDFTKYRSLVSQSLAEDHCKLSDSDGVELGGVNSMHILQEFFANFGELLCCWPDICSAMGAVLKRDFPLFADTRDF